MSKIPFSTPFSITFLVAEETHLQDNNYLRFANELYARGHTVQIGFIDALAMNDSEVMCHGFTLSEALVAEARYPLSHPFNLAESQYIWVMALGLRSNFLDKIQLLHCLEDRCHFINSSQSLMHLKSKYSLANHADIFTYPKSFASTDAAYLYKTIRSQGGQWILKPPAGSMGMDVYLVTAEDPNTRVILDAMTGTRNGASGERYCLAQPYVEEILQGEKRVLFAGGEPVGQYLRLAQQDHRTNIVQGANIETCELSAKEYRYCQNIGKYLLSQGAAFVGLDLAFPYVIEFNVINPGGLLTIESLTGENLTTTIINKIFKNSV